MIASMRNAIDAPSPETHPGPLLSRGDLLAGAWFAGLAFLAWWAWPHLPEQLPNKLDLLERPSGWISKASMAGGAFGLPAFFGLALLALGWGQGNADPALRRAARRSLLPARPLVLVGISLEGARPMLLSLLGTGLSTVLRVAAFGLVAAGALAMLRVFDREQPESRRRHYRWVLLRWEPGDARLRVPRLQGPWKEFNYARPGAWWLTGAFLLIPILVYGFIMLRPDLFIRLLGY